ncbi:MAG: UvrD-helicase domain-containing protein [Deltaproteobacteria bacterium]|nr:UvrD-helicase domain-containing protein [Deltaproteobacteria bacterium]MBW2666165.1 UvrD-helicase domain-containing protein [Deltaproteobacteria bacterium]
MARRGAVDVQAEDILEGLNAEQRKAVETSEGPLLVLAGAGSGKTRVLTHRIAYLVGVCGIPTDGILAVTFTNKAAGEMRERVQKLLGPTSEELWVATFHSTCVRILRRDIGHLGYSRGFVIYDQADGLGVIKDALKRHGLDPKATDPRRIQWRIDEWKNAGIGPGQAAAAATDIDTERAAEIYLTYQRLLVDANALDFNDLLVKTSELFERFPEVLAHYRRRWQYVMVDEYQDTNHVQYKLVQQIAGEHRNLCVVGDPDQSIYAWRGADIRNILDFENDYPDVQTVKLERNYRSTQPILEGASAVVAQNVDRKSKQLYTDREGGDLIEIFEAEDDREEVRYVVRRILAEVRGGDRSGGDVAIFYRTNAQSRVFEEEFLKYDVPYVIVGGVRFYDRAEVKDALAYLRVLLNPVDTVSLKRIINKPARGIGKTTIDRADDSAIANGTTLLDALRVVAAGGSGGRSAPKVAAFLEMMDELRHDIDGRRPADAIAHALDRTGYLRVLEAEGTPEAEARVENLKELIAAADDFDRANAEIEQDERSELELFLDQVALVSDLDSYDRREDCVSLMTVHSAKGLEFPIVFVVGMEEGVFPHSASMRDESGIEEERRLCYVAMTRAMEKLTLTCAAERFRFGSRTYGVPSRFLKEIPSHLVASARPRRASAAPARGTTDSNLDYSYGQAEAGESPELAPGLAVRHPIFGRGSILAVLGAGPGQKLRIRFERAGVKTLVVRFANLELG